MENLAELWIMLRNSPPKQRLNMLLAHDMDENTAPFLTPTPGLPLQKNHHVETSTSPSSHEMTELPKEHMLEKNGTVLQLMPREIIAASLPLGVLWLLSIFGNSLVCLVIHRSRRTQSTTNYFVVSMACADLLISVGSTPFVLLQLASGRWTLGSMMCKLVRYFQYLTPGVQIYVLLSICVDRFYTIVYPLSFKVSREKAKKMIVASWIFDAALASPAFFFFGSGWDNHCRFFPPYSWDGAVYSIIHLLVAFLIPSVLIIIFYQKIIKYIWRIGTDSRTVRRTMNIVPRTKVKTIKMFLMLNVFFLLSWLPFYVVQLWHPLETDYRKSSLVFMLIIWISFSSSASKPTLYYVYNANFRRGMKETFCMSSMKCYRSNAYTITTSSKIAKKNYVGISEVPVPTKTVSKDSIYDSFDREAKEKKLAWPINSNPPNTFV
ncbi:probable G-protein coupled receptor 19 isoform X1 [Hemicordylus capensis]|uniref:probable G-protein coupled receptor 19 isoform X1 n=2 Tax=Hemicordylus capensis TaxID=884348 RepID=UPI002303770C|nr:probable G-protein coupled receptor 19 isoform X1 [Hemicordylus capensis]XP_053109008.1 probable G-protein coupled receptor 19 isoform X1 [Hemicordylus capensis]